MKLAGNVALISPAHPNQITAWKALLQEGATGRPVERKAMIDRDRDLPMTRQAEAVYVSRSSIYYLPRPAPEADLAIMRRLDRPHLEYLFAGARMLKGLLAAEGNKIGRRHVNSVDEVPADE
jgi:hypothetical protein